VNFCVKLSTTPTNGRPLYGASAGAVAPQVTVQIGGILPPLARSAGSASWASCLVSLRTSRWSSGCS
jgi:hypothetical protein